jgi:hypothetical protein
LKVFRTDLHLPDLFDHRNEVRQGTDRSQRRGAGGPYEPPSRSQNERILNRFNRHAALMQLGRQHPLRAADATRARSRTVGV